MARKDKKRAVILIISAAALSGCATTSGSLKLSVQKSINDVLLQEACQADLSKTYYSYYIEPSVGRYSSNETGNVFTYEGTKFLMNLNIPSIVSQAANSINGGTGMETIKNPDIALDGNYTDADGSSHIYSLQIDEQGSRCLILMNTDTVNFYAAADSVKAPEMSGEMLKIARSIEVQTDAVLAAYTSEKILNYKTEKTQLYHEIVPESGNISELINDSGTAGTGSGSSQNTDSGQADSDHSE